MHVNPSVCAVHSVLYDTVWHIYKPVQTRSTFSIVLIAVTMLSLLTEIQQHLGKLILTVVDPLRKTSPVYINPIDIYSN